MNIIYKNENDFVPSVNRDKIKSKFMELWKDIFHDSDEYISLLFDTYFDSSLFEVCLDNDDKLISALLGIPYNFGFKDKKIRTLYLCGLSTREDYRGQGIMKEMIRRVCKRGEKLGFAMAFLVPASDTLRRYYHFSGFTEGIGRVAERYVADHDFYREYAASLSGCDDEKRMNLLRDFRSAKVEFPVIFDGNSIGEYYQFVTENRTNRNVSILHNERDLSCVLKENIISGGFVAMVRNSGSDEISALATVCLMDDEMVIPHLWVKDKVSRFILLDAIKVKNPELPLLVWNPTGLKEADQLKENYFEGYDPEQSIDGWVDSDLGVESRSDRVVPYSMIRILSVSEILKFLGDTSDLQKFSILVKMTGNAEKGEQIRKFTYNNGTVTDEQVDSKSENNSVTLQQLQNILFEPERGESAEILNLPHANLSAYDLLD